MEPTLKLKSKGFKSKLPIDIIRPTKKNRNKNICDKYGQIWR
jgi:hypothetical protein